MKIVVLDSYTITQNDLNWESLRAAGHDVIVYDRTPAELVKERIGDADGVFISKVIIDSQLLDACPNLKFISVMATGYNNVDTEAAKARGIALCNVPAYSTESVAQHVFAFILQITNHVSIYDKAVKDGMWEKATDFSFYLNPLYLLHGKSIGIFGFGQIGKQVGKIAEAFGMTVYPYSKNPEEAIKADIVTLHCPATETTIGMVNKDFISKMKDGAIFINASRGTLVNEQDLADALKSGKILAAGLDVLSVEPPKDNPLINLENCFITPHVAWSPKEMREIVINVCTNNVESFVSGGQLNRIV